jgi:hypothetical protein
MTKFLKNADVTGYISQTSVTSSLVKTDADGKLVAAVAGTDYNAPGVTASAGTLVREIRNTTGATLTKGTIVYISGATGNKPTVSKALATGDSTSAQTFGMCQTDISNNSNGNVVVIGDITGLDTSAFTEGAQLYLSSTTAGTYTTTKQLAPAHLVYIGVVTRSHPTQGQIEVKIQNGYELDEIHDVAISSLANNQGLFYESATDLWKNKTIATVLGYTPQPQLSGTGFVKIDGTTISYDNSTYLTTTNAASTYLPLIGGTLTGVLRVDSALRIKSGAANGILLETYDTNELRIRVTPASTTFDSSLIFPSASRNFTFPNASGTIALTSDIVTYTLPTATASVLGGVKIGGGVSIDAGGVISVSTNYQAPLGGTGFVKSTAGVISYDTNTYLTSYTETDTLQSVILRNGTTNTGFTITNTNDTYTSAASTNVPVIYLYNTGTTSTSNAIIALRTSSATGGDPILSFDIGGVIGWSMGIDNSDSDKFKIARSWTALDSETRFSMALDGTANFTGSLTAANLSGTNTGDQTNISGASTRLSSRDNRTISPSEDSASELRFGFTSWANNDSAPYADYLHLRSYSDNSGGSDNLVMFLKSGIGMRIWQQTYGSGTAYSSYADVLHSSNYSSYALPLTGGTMSGQILAPSTGADVYGGAIHIRERGYVLAAQSAWSFSPAITFHWGDRAASRFGLRADGLMAVDEAPIALRSWVTAQGYITGYTETDTLASVTGRGASTSTALSINNNVTITSGRLVLQSGGANTYGVISGYANNNHFITMRGAVTGTAASPTITGADQTTFVEFADANDITGWFFKSASTGTYQEIARITRSTFNYNGNTVIHSGNIASQSVNYSNYSNYLSNNYNGGVSSNPQTYFGQGVGVKVAMTGQWGVWSDTLWINGYGGGDVLQMCALHTQRNGTPRMGISVQASNSTSYGTIYEVITSYNIASQSVSSAANVAWSGVTSKPADIFFYEGFTLDGNTMSTNASGFTYAVNAPYGGPIMRIGAAGYSLQFNAGYGGGGEYCAFRTRNGDSGTFNSWHRILNTGLDPIPAAMNQYVRTTDNVAFNALSLPTGGRVIINGETDVWGVRFRTTVATANLGSQLKNIIWCGGGALEGLTITGVDTGPASMEVRNNGVVFVKDSFYNTNSTGTIQSGSTSLDGMLFDSGRPALVARGNYPHVEIWASIANSNHGGTLRFGGYDNGSSGAYKSWHIGTAAADLYFLDIGYGGTSNSNPHAGIAGLGASYGYAGAFTSMRFHNNGNVGIGNFGTYGSLGDNTPAFKLDVRGTGRFTGALYGTSPYFTSTNTSGVWGYAGSFIDSSNAANNYVPFSFENSYGNHSWGIIARFHMRANGGTDRGSIQFSSDFNNTRWSVGYCYPDDNFRITQNHGYRPDNSTNDGWGTERLRISTDGAAQFFSTLTATAFFESSDSRLKTLITDNVQVSGIENLTAKLYIKDGREEYGYYAQDAQKYMPSAVVANDKGYLNLSYREVHTVKIARLEKEVEELKSQLARL